LFDQLIIECDQIAAASHQSPCIRVCRAHCKSLEHLMETSSEVLTRFIGSTCDAWRPTTRWCPTSLH